MQNYLTVRELAEEFGLDRTACLRWVKRWCQTTGHRLGWAVVVTEGGRQRVRAVKTDVAAAMRAARATGYIEDGRK